MSTELTIKDTDLLATVTQTELSDLIKPLVNEIHLFDTHIAGTVYIQDKSLFDALKEKENLTLQREDNRFDAKAILVLNGEKKKLG